MSQPRPTFPGPLDLWRHYLGFLDALRALSMVVREGGSSLEDFRGLSLREAGQRIADLREELEDQSVLMLFASFEAEIMSACRKRVGWRSKPTSKKLRKLFKAKGRPSLMDVLEEMKAEIDSQALKEFQAIYGHRHRLAHGRFFKPRAGVAVVEAKMVLDRGLRILESMPGGYAPEAG